MTTQPQLHPRALISGLTISVIGALFYNVLPLFVGTAQDSLSLTNLEAGTLGTAFFIGYNLVTLASFFWIDRYSWRTLTLAWLIFSLLMLAAITTTQTYWIITILVAGAGGGFAALYAIGTAVIAQSNDPTRWYGVKIAVEAIPGAALLILLPTTLIAHYGFDGMIMGLGFATAILALGLRWLPAGSLSVAASSEQDRPQKPDVQKLPVIIALFGCFLFFTAASGIWAFLERIGSAMQFAPNEIGQLLALTLVFATFGSLVCALLGSRFREILPISLGIMGFTLALGLMNSAGSFLAYATAATLITFSIGLVLPLLLGLISTLDCDGRFIVLSVPAIGLGAMLGPLLAGATIDKGGFESLYLYVGVLALSSLIVTYWSQRGSPR